MQKNVLCHTWGIGHNKSHNKMIFNRIALQKSIALNIALNNMSCLCLYVYVSQWLSDFLYHVFIHMFRHIIYLCTLYLMYQFSVTFLLIIKS